MAHRIKFEIHMYDKSRQHGIDNPHYLIHVGGQEVTQMQDMPRKPTQSILIAVDGRWDYSVAVACIRLAHTIAISLGINQDGISINPLVPEGIWGKVWWSMSSKGTERPVINKNDPTGPPINSIFVNGSYVLDYPSNLLVAYGTNQWTPNTIKINSISEEEPVNNVTNDNTMDSNSHTINRNIEDSGAKSELREIVTCPHCGKTFEVVDNE